MLKFLVLGALVAVALTAPVTPTNGWVLGKPGESCSTVCKNAGGPACLGRSLKAITNNSKFKNITAPFTSVIKYGGGLKYNIDYAPAQHADTKVTYLSSGSSTPCGQVPPARVRRVCCCSATPCLPDYDDCVVGEWTEYDTCSKSCGTGAQTRTRAIKKQPFNGGAACPAVTEVRECATNACPIDCEVSEWVDTTDCSASCGEEGFKTRTRSVTVETAHGGEECPSDFEEVVSCNVFACPVDCEVDGWTEYGECSESCGTEGVHMRTRGVVTEPAHGGEECPELEQTEPCNVFACPVDCEVSEWTEYGECSESCGTEGVHTRTRYVITDAQHGGKECPGDYEEVVSCNIFDCPVDCVMSEWSAYSNCPVTCGGGVVYRARTKLTNPENGGEECPTTTSETEACNTAPCPANCVTSPWSSWTTCSAGCNGGTTSRSRSITTPAEQGGSCNGPFVVTNTCNTASCPTCATTGCSCTANTGCLSNKCTAGKCE